MATRLVAFCSDYGLDDPFVGLCHAAVAAVAPDVAVVDLTHAIARHDVRAGGLLLADCLAWLPPAVLLAVVDPGVGTDRLGVVIAAGDRHLVGPDNGLLWPAVALLGGPAAAWALHEDPGAPRTFHGRDVFAPAAGRLAAGAPPEDVGEAVDPATLVVLPEPAAAVRAGQLTAEVVRVDVFGNVALSARAGHLDEAGLRPGAALRIEAPVGAVEAEVATTFGDVLPGSVALLPDALGRLQVAVNRGNAAELLDAAPGTRLVVNLDTSATNG